MRLSSVVKQSFERTGLVFALVPLVNHLARRRQKGVLRIFPDGDLWIHQTTFGYFAYHEPYIRLDMHVSTSWRARISSGAANCGPGTWLSTSAQGQAKRR